MECQITETDRTQAAKCAKRLLGPPPIVPAGIYMSVYAKENLWTGDTVIVDSDGGARKWDRGDFPHGIAIGPLGKGMFGWIQVQS
jgi:hypothetical protein